MPGPPTQSLRHGTVGSTTSIGCESKRLQVQQQRIGKQPPVSNDQRTILGNHVEECDATLESNSKWSRARIRYGHTGSACAAARVSRGGFAQSGVGTCRSPGSSWGCATAISPAMPAGRHSSWPFARHASAGQGAVCMRCSSLRKVSSHEKK